MSTHVKSDLKSVPLEHRFIETVSPGFFFGDTCEMKWPKQSWTDCEAVAKELRRKKNSTAVGFMRYIYDPAEGKVYLDDGWQYFVGEKFTNSELVSGEAEKRCPSLSKAMNSIARGNIKSNRWDCVWIEKYGKIWPLYSGDSVISQRKEAMKR